MRKATPPSPQNTARRTCLAHLAVIRRAGAYLPTKVSKMLYQSFMVPHFDYCVVWHHCRASQTGRLERVQNYALRIILRKPPRTRSEPLRETLGMSTLKRRWQIQTVKQVHRCLLGRAPSYLGGNFVTNASFRDFHITTRGAGQIHLNQPHTEFYKTTSSFKYAGAKLFNALPENIRSISNPDRFRSMVNRLF